MRCSVINRGRPRTAVTAEQVRKLADGPKHTTWKQIADKLGISPATAMRLYKSKEGKGE